MDNRYYFDNQKNDLVVFDEKESVHLSKVRRAQVGDIVVGFNGDGYDYNLQIESISKSGIQAKIISKTENRASGEKTIVVYLAMLKNEAMTTAIDNLSELNVKEVKLFRSERSIAIIDENKLNKLKTISIQASKQCERADVMEISLIDEKDIEKDIMQYENRFFAYEDSVNNPQKFSGGFAVVVGPEGGFSSNENDYFSSFCKNISLSKTILRAEVACIVAVNSLKVVSL